MDEKKRLMKNSAIIAVGGFSSKMIAFLLLPLYTAYLSTSEFGDYDYIITISMMVAPFVTMLMQESMFRFLIDAKEEEKNRVISHSIFIILANSLIFSLIMVGLYLVIQDIFMLYVMFYVYSLVIAGFVGAIYRGIGKMAKFTIFNFLLSITAVVCNIIFIVGFKWGLFGLFGGFVVSHFVIGVLALLDIRIWKYLSIKGLSIKYIKEMLKFSIPLIPNSISWTIINFSDRIIIYNVLGDSSNGIYSVACNFPSLIDTVYGFFLTAWRESSARVLHGTKEEAQKFYNDMYKNLKHVLFCFSLMVIALMPLLYKLLVNISFHDGYIYSFILILAVYCSNISGFYGGIFTAYKETRIMGTSTIIAAILNLAINFSLVYFIGLYAAAISTLVSGIYIVIHRRIQVKKYITFSKDTKFTVLASIMTLIIVGLFLFNNLIICFVSVALVTAFTVYTNLPLIKAVYRKLKKKKEKKKNDLSC